MPNLSITNWRIERSYIHLSAVRIYECDQSCYLASWLCNGTKKKKKNPFTNVSLSASRAWGERVFDNLATIHHPTHPLTIPRFPFVHYFFPWPFLPSSNHGPTHVLRLFHRFNWFHWKRMLIGSGILSGILESKRGIYN